MIAGRKYQIEGRLDSEIAAAASSVEIRLHKSMPRGQSTTPSTHFGGIPDSPTVAPANAPIIAPVVSASPPQPITDRTAFEKSP